MPFPADGPSCAGLERRPAALARTRRMREPAVTRLTALSAVPAPPLPGLGAGRDGSQGISVTEAIQRPFRSASINV